MTIGMRDTSTTWCGISAYNGPWVWDYYPNAVLSGHHSPHLLLAKNVSLYTFSIYTSRQRFAIQLLDNRCDRNVNAYSTGQLFHVFFFNLLLCCCAKLSYGRLKIKKKNIFVYTICMTTFILINISILEIK